MEKIKTRITLKDLILRHVRMSDTRFDRIITRALVDVKIVDVGYLGLNSRYTL